MIKTTSVTRRRLTLLFQFFSVGMALTPLIALYGQKYGYTPDLHMSSWIHVFIALSCCVYFAIYRADSKSHQQFSITGKNQLITNPLLIVMLIIAWMTMTLIWAEAKGLAIYRLIDWVLGLLGLMLVMLLCRTQQHRLFMFNCLFISVIGVSIMGILQHLLDVNWILQAAKPGSFFSNKNRAAQFIVLLWPLGCYLWLRAQSILQYYLYSGGITLVISYIIYTDTRAVWVGMLVQFIVLSMMFLTLFKDASHANKTHRRGSVGFALLLLVMMVPLSASGWSMDQIWFIGEEAQTITNAMLQFNDKDLRIIMWANSWELIKSNWLLGVGIGNWLVEYPVYHQTAIIDYFMTLSSQHNHAHNDYIEFASELGIIGISLILCLGISILLRLITVTKDVSEEQRFAACTLFICMLGLAVDCLFSFPLQKTVIIVFSLLVLGLFLAIDDNGDIGNDKNQTHVNTSTKFNTKSWLSISIKQKQATVFTLAFSVIVAMLIISHINWYQAEVDKRLAIRAANKQDFNKVLLHSQRSYELNPWQPTILNTVAIAHYQLKNFQAAVDALELSFEEQPHTLYNLFNISDFYLKMQDYERARKHLSHLNDIRPYDYLTQEVYGKLLYYYIKDYPKAIEHLSMAKGLTDNEDNQLELEKLIVKSKQKLK